MSAHSTTYRSTYQIVDAHCHFDHQALDLVERLVATSGIVGCLNLWDGAWPPPDTCGWAQTLRPLGPTVGFCHVPDLSRIGDDSSEELRRAVKASRSCGAAGVKVWKNLGLWLTDGDGRLLSILDRRLDGLWEAAAEESMPVVIHVGDPPAFFAPVDEANPRYEELKDHPDWCYANGPFPSLERLHQDFIALLARQPQTVFVAAHFGCFLPFATLRDALATHDNLHVDTSARVADLGGPERVLARDIVLTFPSRVLFGTDFARTVHFELPVASADRGDLSANHSEHYRFFETDERVTLPFPFQQSSEPIVGLALPADVLDAVYAGNARRLFEHPWPAHAPARP